MHRAPQALELCSLSPARGLAALVGSACCVAPLKEPVLVTEGNLRHVRQIKEERLCFVLSQSPQLVSYAWGVL